MKLKTRSKVLIMTVMSVTVFILIVRIVGFSFENSPFSFLLMMKPVTTVCFLMIAVAFFATISGNGNVAQRVLIYVFSFIPCLIGILRLTGINLFLIDQAATRQLYSSAPNTALNFVLLGTSVILMAHGSRNGKIAVNYLISALLLITLFAAIAHIYAVKDFFGILSYVPMPIITTICFGLAGMAVVFSNTDNGFMVIIFNKRSSGTIARILVPSIILVPIILGYIRLIFHWKFFPIAVELGVAFLISGIILLLFALVLYVSHVIDEKDKEKEIVEHELAKINMELEKKVLERTVEVSRNEKRFRSLVENEYSLTSLMNGQLGITYQSPSSEFIMGWTPEEQKTIGILELVHPDDRVYLKKIMGEVLANPEKPYPITLRSRHKNGSYVWLEGISINKLNDPDIGGIVSNLHDVTERRVLEEQQKLFMAIVNSSDDAILSKTLDGVITSWNKGAERLYHYTAEEAIGQNVAILIPPDRLDEEPKIIEQIKSGEIVDHFETVRVKKNGDMVDVSLSISPIKDNRGNVIGAAKIARDISDRKENERRLVANERKFRVLIENITDGIVVNDENSILMYQSPSVTKILGYTPEEREGKQVLSYVHPDDRQEFSDLFERLKQNPAVPLPFTYRFLHKKGSYIWLEGVVTNLLNDPSIKAYVANYRDITERKKADAEIQALNIALEERVALRTKQLEAANKEMEAFTYSVSHDLRAPLRIIDGYSQILLEDYHVKLDTEGRRILNVITSNARRMGQLIDDLLNLSRVGKSAIRMATVNMNHLVDDVLLQLKLSGVSIPEKLTVDNLGSANCDENLIKQVWMNLISNAIKYSSNNPSPDIRIGMKVEKGEFVYNVRDNGAGFDMLYYKKLFGVFQRLHKQEEFSGTGVGLAIVQRIVLRHGGKVWADAALGKGASFFFSLPQTSGKKNLLPGVGQESVKRG